MGAGSATATVYRQPATVYRQPATVYQQPATAKVHQQPALVKVYRQPADKGSLSSKSSSCGCNPAVIAAIVAVVCAIIAVVTGCLHQNIACYTMVGISGVSAILALCCRNKTSSDSVPSTAAKTGFSHEASADDLDGDSD